MGEKLISSPELWRLAVCALQDEGIAEGTARSFLGLMLKTWEERYVRDAVLSAIGKANFRGAVRAHLIYRCPQRKALPDPQAELLPKESQVDPAKAREAYQAHRERIMGALKR